MILIDYHFGNFYFIKCNLLTLGYFFYKENIHFNIHKMMHMVAPFCI